MRPPKPTEPASDDTGRVRLTLIVSHAHPLFELAEAIDWTRFESEFGTLYAEEVGRPGLPTRLMVGLHYLKYLFDEEDESVTEKFVENPYWQFLCGGVYFEHELPCHPTSMRCMRTLITERHFHPPAGKSNASQRSDRQPPLLIVASKAQRTIREMSQFTCQGESG